MIYFAISYIQHRSLTTAIDFIVQISHHIMCIKNNKKVIHEMWSKFVYFKDSCHYFHEYRNILWHWGNMIQPRNILLCSTENVGLLPPADQKANCSISSFTSTSFHRATASVVTDWVSAGVSKGFASILTDETERVVNAWSDCLRDSVGHLAGELKRCHGCFYSMGDWMFQERTKQQQKNPSIVPPVKCRNTEEHIKFKIYLLRACHVSERAFSVWVVLENKTKVSYLHEVLMK